MSFLERKKKNVKRAAIIGSVAAAAGYAAGVLTAPKSGKATRQGLKKVADKTYDEAEKDLKELNGELLKLVREAKSGSKKLSTRAQKELNDAIETAKDTKEKGREMLSAVREGSAKDKDLKKAMKDADAALKHLRDYLKK